MTQSKKQTTKKPRKKRDLTKKPYSSLEEHKPNTELRKKVENLWALGFSKIAISRQIGIHDQTLERHYKLQLRPEVYGKDASALGRQTIIDNARLRNSNDAAKVLLKLGGELKDDITTIPVAIPALMERFVTLPDGSKVTMEQYLQDNPESEDDSTDNS
jgi:hypothetical protein